MFDDDIDRLVTAFPIAVVDTLLNNDNDSFTYWTTSVASFRELLSMWI